MARHHWETCPNQPLREPIGGAGPGQVLLIYWPDIGAGLVDGDDEFTKRPHPSGRADSKATRFMQ